MEELPPSRPAEQHRHFMQCAFNAAMCAPAVINADLQALWSPGCCFIPDGLQSGRLPKGPCKIALFYSSGLGEMALLLLYTCNSWPENLLGSNYWVIQMNPASTKDLFLQYIGGMRELYKIVSFKGSRTFQKVGTMDKKLEHSEGNFFFLWFNRKRTQLTGGWNPKHKWVCTKHFLPGEDAVIGQYSALK